MKRPGSIWYHTSMAFGFALMWRVVACEWRVLHLWPKMRHKGFLLVDPFPETRNDFQQSTQDALNLIETHDPLRFARLNREIRSLVNMPLRGSAGAEYCRWLRNCRIDLLYFRLSEDREMAIRLLALRLVHESTHGYLCSKRVRQRKHRVRVELLCYKEEARFARKLGLDLGPNWPFIKEELKPPPPAERRSLAARG